MLKIRLYVVETSFVGILLVEMDNVLSFARLGNALIAL